MIRLSKLNLMAFSIAHLSSLDYKSIRLAQRISFVLSQDYRSIRLDMRVRNYALRDLEIAEDRFRRRGRWVPLTST